jgi:nucleoside-diphosphate-sugar epimerase
VALQRIAGGAPIVIVLPSQVYGPGDHSGVGEQLEQAFRGKLPYVALDDLGLALVHVDDLARGIVAALERGRVAESYVLAGPTTTLGAAEELAASLGGRKLPAIRLPTELLRLARPLGRLIGQPNLAEVISASAGVTYWASSAKAERELGFRARSIEDGLRDTFGPGASAASNADAA